MADLLLQLQQDLVDKLNSEAALQYNSIVSYRKEVIAAEIKRRLPHLTAKNGKKGCGAIVNMPTIEAYQPNIKPPQGFVIPTIDVFENPEINFLTHGTKITAEQLARSIRVLLHQFAIEGVALLYQDASVITPLLDVDKIYAGCLGYRVTMRGRMSEQTVPVSALPALAYAAGAISFSGADAGADVYFTIDGTFPGPGNSDGVATLYTVPVAVASGSTVRWAAYTPSAQGSIAAQAVVA